MPTTRSLEDTVVSIVYHNTGGPQRDRVPWHVIMTILTSHSHFEVYDVWQALRASVEAERLASDEDETEFWIPN